MNLSNQDQARGRDSASATSSGSWNTDPVPSCITAELEGLAAKGFTAPLPRKNHPKQGEKEADVHLLQTVWCRYAGQAVSQPTNIWSAALSSLAAAQSRDQQQQQDRQRHLQVQQLPTYTTPLSTQHPAHLVTKGSLQEQLQTNTANTFEGYALPPASVGDVWSRVAALQDSQALDKTAQQELAELLEVSNVDRTATYHTEPAEHQDNQQQQQQPTAWVHPRDQTDGDTLLQPHAASNGHGSLGLSPLSSPSAELSHILSWSQLSSPHKGHKQQQQALASDRGSSPVPALGNDCADAWWAQQGSQAASKLDISPCEPDHDVHIHPLGAASAHAHQVQQEPSQWLQALEMARAVRPRQLSHQDFAHASGAPRAPFYGSAPHLSNREDSGDLSTSLGTQMFLGRAHSSASARLPGLRDCLMPAGVASPKSSLGSNMPSLAQSFAQLPQNTGGRAGVMLHPGMASGAQPVEPGPAKLLMQLVAAPSTFGVPMCTGKLLSPPFRVRVAMLCEVPTKLQLTLKAYVLSKDNLSSLEQWHPAHHIVTEAVTGGEVQQTVLCSEDPALGDAAGGAAGVGASQSAAPDMLGGVADFVFRDLKFTTSSRMQPRWLVIAAVLPSQDVMYVQYNVPTIVMSRACDQLTKAISILKGIQQGPGLGVGVGAAPRKRHRNSSSLSKPVLLKPEEPVTHASPTLLSSSSPPDEDRDDSMDWPTAGPFTFHRWHFLVERKYNAFNLVRPLGLDDLHMMERVAGFHEQGQDKQAPNELTAHQWAFFGVWYLSYLRIFRSHQQLWMMQCPVVICGFGVDRHRAEHLLADQPVGTFLVRPGLSLAGCMVISAVVPEGPCKHMALDSNQLSSRSLEVWVRDVLEAQQVLDYRTGQRSKKSEAFPLHYQPFGVVSDVFSHQSAQA
ncbi:TPA: hypothetical protein ACH3X2_009772 [Trebouxia sp. C0005]